MSENKNNQAYDRLREARKIWGGIVNSSRAWGSAVKAYVSGQFVDGDYSEENLYVIKRRLIYRHIGWLYALRSHLREMLGETDLPPGIEAVNGVLM